MSGYRDYTPQLKASKTSPTLGAGGVAFGRFVQIEKLVSASVQVNFGTGSVSNGNGDYALTLPTKARKNKGNSVVGYGWIFHNQQELPGISFRLVVLELSEDTESVFIRMDHMPRVSAEVPWVWGEGDTITASLQYEVD